MASNYESSFSCAKVKEPKKRKESGGVSCAVDGCCSYQGFGYAVHRFPKDTPTRQKWIQFVRIGRANFGPTKYIGICQLHFEKDSYRDSVELMHRFGIRANRILKPGAIPTIHKPAEIRTSCPCTTSTTTTVITTTATRPSTVTTAIASMDRPVTTVTATTTSGTMSSSAIACTQPVSSTPAVGLPFAKTLGGAFQKREQQRIMEEEPELPKVKIEIDIAEEPPEYWMTDQPQGALSDSAVKMEPVGERNVLDSGACTTTSHEMGPVVVKTEVKEETDTDCDVKPALSHSPDVLAVERGQAIMHTVCNSRERITDEGITVKIEDEFPETVAEEKKSSKRLHVCEICGKEFGWASHLKQHVIVHSAQKNFVCDVCNKAFSRADSLTSHMSMHTGQKEFLCEICNKGLAAASSLKMHRLIFHSGPKDYVCDVCNKSFIHASRLKQHTLTHTGQKDFVCDICKKGFTKLYDLTQHELLHTGKKNFVCHVCNKAFAHSKYLKTHMKLIHTGQKDFVCDVCNKSYTVAYHLKQHKLTHNGHKDHLCDVCNAAFICASSLKRHKLTHTDLKNFVCDVCNKAFTQEKYLKAHMLIHTGQKDLACDVCDRAFIFRRDLKRHMLTHSGQKNFVCDICNKAFMRGGCLKRHQKTHTQTKTAYRP